MDVFNKMLKLFSILYLISCFSYGEDDLKVSNYNLLRDLAYRRTDILYPNSEEIVFIEEPSFTYILYCNPIEETDPTKSATQSTTETKETIRTVAPFTDSYGYLPTPGPTNPQEPPTPKPATPELPTPLPGTPKPPTPSPITDSYGYPTPRPTNTQELPTPKPATPELLTPPPATPKPPTPSPNIDSYGYPTPKPTNLPEPPTPAHNTDRYDVPIQTPPTEIHTALPQLDRQDVQSKIPELTKPLPPPIVEMDKTSPTSSPPNEINITPTMGQLLRKLSKAPLRKYKRNATIRPSVAEITSNSSQPSSTDEKRNGHITLHLRYKRGMTTVSHADIKQNIPLVCIKKRIPISSPKGDKRRIITTSSFSGIPKESTTQSKEVKGEKTTDSDVWCIPKALILAVLLSLLILTGCFAFTTVVLVLRQKKLTRVQNTPQTNIS